jgi:hypothetical protein
MVGRDVKLPIANALNPPNGDGKDAERNMQKLTSRVEAVRIIAKENMSEHQQRFKKVYDLNAEATDYASGTRVLLFNPKVSQRKASKRLVEWKGPYYIASETSPSYYVIRDCKTDKEIDHPVHVNRIKIFKDRNMFRKRDQSTGRGCEPQDDDTETSDEESPQNIRQSTHTVIPELDPRPQAGEPTRERELNPRPQEGESTRKQHSVSKEDTHRPTISKPRQQRQSTQRSDCRSEESSQATDAEGPGENLMQETRKLNRYHRIPINEIKIQMGKHRKCHPHQHTR